MKIIERHDLPRASIIIHRITCDKCHSVFEADPRDFHYEVVGHGMSGDAINCPVCGNHIHECYGIGAEKWEIIRS